MNKPLKNTIGLDIKNRSITAVELAYAKKGLKVVNYSRVELEPDVIEDNCIIVNPDAFKEAMGRLLKEGYAGPFSSHNAIISIPEEKTFTHKLCIANDQSDDNDYILEKAKDFIPIELSEAAVDYKTLQSCDSKTETKFNFVAVQKTIIEAIIQNLSDIGIKVVFVDVDKNSVVRACNNRFQSVEADYMVLDVDTDLTTYSIVGASGLSYTLDSDIGGAKLIEQAKASLNVPTKEEIQKLISAIRGNPEANAKQAESFKKAIVEPMTALVQQITELSQIAQTQDSIQFKTIYLVGRHSKIPGIGDYLSQAFPGVKIIQKFDYIELDENTETLYPMAIGLALRAILPEEPNHEINLLPVSKKEELINRMLTPVIVKSLVGSFVFLAILTLFSGFLMARNYIGMKVTEKEVEISNEKAQSPYLHQAAQENQFKTQLASQMEAVLSDSIPGGYYMSSVDEYNDTGIGLVSVSYKLNNDGSNNIRLRARTKSRAETEKFISKLEEDEQYDDVLSPLSNLTGKGERFISIDLSVNLENIINAHKSLNKPAEESSPKKPELTPKRTSPKSPEKPAETEKVEEEVDEEGDSAEEAEEADESEEETITPTP